MRVIPECSGIWRLKDVFERSSGANGVLSEPRDSIHFVLESYAVPVDRSRLGQFVAKANLDRFALPCAQCWPGRLTIIAPQAALYRAAEEPGRKLARYQLYSVRRLLSRGTGEQL